MDNDELVRAWLASQDARGLSRNSLGRRKTSMQSLVVSLHPTPLHRADTDLIEDWLRQFSSQRTKYHYRSDAKLFYEWAVRRKLIEHNPVEGVGRIRLPQSVPKPYNHEEVGRMLACLRFMSTQDRRIVGLGLCAGLRAFEMAGLEWPEVRLHEGIVVVRHGKGNKDRVIPLHPILVDLLSPQETTGAVITGPRGGHLTPGTISARARRLFLTLAIDNGHTHRLRHTFGTEASRASGGDLHAVAELMGHANLATTLGYTMLGANRRSGVVLSMWAPEDPAA